MPVINLMLEPIKGPLADLGRTLGSTFLSDLSEANMAPPGDAIEHYNKWQLPFAFIIAFLVAFTQYLRWKDTDMKKFRHQIAFSLLIALLSTALAVIVLKYRFQESIQVALFFSAAFAVAANAGYIWKGLKGRFAHAGASIAHVGFALVLLGALISAGRQDEVSHNARDLDLRFLSEDFSNNKDILLYKGDTVRMGDHYVHYREKELHGVNLHFRMDYFAVEPRRYHAGDTVRVREMLFVCANDHVATEEFLTDQPLHWSPIEKHTQRALWHAPTWEPTRPGEELFTLEPFVQLNPRFGNVAEPSTRHWFHKDLYTHVRYADLDVEDTTAYMPPRLYEKMLGDTIVTPTSIIVMDSLRTVRDSVTMRMLGSDYSVYMLRMRVRDLYDRTRWFEAKPVVIYRNGAPVASKGFEVPELRVRYDLTTVESKEDGVHVGLNVFEQEFVVMQAIVFPGINILWLGCVLLFLGTLLAVRQRIKRTDRQ